MLRFAIGSTSDIKRNALAQSFPGCIIYPIDCPSRVPEQPIGKEQTLQGARNRAMGALAECAEPIDWAVGIESGMWDGKDGAAIVLIKVPTGETKIAWSEELQIPENHPPGPSGRWSKWKDPHSMIVNRSRADFISDAIKKSLT